ncbi:MAG: hypothetical protein ACLSTO_06315 [Bilophila wadsworthia]
MASRLEGVYDPASGTVYLVADNLPVRHVRRKYGCTRTWCITA